MKNENEESSGSSFSLDRFAIFAFIVALASGQRVLAGETGGKRKAKNEKRK
jgi:hypothetical protein